MKIPTLAEQMEEALRKAQALTIKCTEERGQHRATVYRGQRKVYITRDTNTREQAFKDAQAFVLILRESDRSAECE